MLRQQSDNQWQLIFGQAGQVTPDGHQAEAFIGLFGFDPAYRRRLFGDVMSNVFTAMEEILKENEWLDQTTKEVSSL